MANDHCRLNRGLQHEDIDDPLDIREGTATDSPFSVTKSKRVRWNPGTPGRRAEKGEKCDCGKIANMASITQIDVDTMYGGKGRKSGCG